MKTEKFEGGKAGLTKNELKKLYEIERSGRKIAKIKGVNPTTVRYWMLKQGVKINSHEEAQRLRAIKLDFSTRPDLCYLLGLLKGDGCIYEKGKHHLVQFAVTSETLADEAKKTFEAVGLHPWKQVANRTDCRTGKMFIIRAKSLLFCEWYKALTNAEIEKLLIGSNENCIMFIKGFYEAEGHYSKRLRLRKGRKKPYLSHTIEISNKNVELLNYIKKLLTSILNIESGSIRWRQTAYVLPIYKKDHISRFFKTVNPCIKNGGDIM